jgi:2-polyprenyl-3-methyl-5-hydroxy-6-metoxy-1,4-benzoquinol methylase
MLESRSAELEIIDLGSDYYTIEEYEDCLIKLDRIGRWLGGDRATLSALQKMPQAPLSILDVGCGGGLFTTRLALRYPNAKVVGIDLNPAAIEFAKRRLASMRHRPQNLFFETRTQKKLEEAPKSYDVVTSTLVCHHIPDDHLTDFISRACSVAKRKVLINDLHRHSMALYLFKVISPILFHNRLVQHDGPLSIRRAFKYDELLHCLKMAGLKPSQYSISWRWAFRWLIEINCEG